MSILIAILLLCAVAAGWTAYPLLSAESDLDRGDGLEAEGRLAAWTKRRIGSSPRWLRWMWPCPKDASLRKITMCKGAWS